METVLYELRWEISLFPVVILLLFSALEVFCIRLLIRRKSTYQGWRNRLFPVLLGLMLVLGWYGALLRPAMDHLALRRAWENGQALVTEGEVEHLDTGYSGKMAGWYDHFTVNGVEFAYNSWAIYFPGYNQCGGAFGGRSSVITGDGQRLRITYLPHWPEYNNEGYHVPDWPFADGEVNAIVRIEVLSE